MSSLSFLKEVELGLFNICEALVEYRHSFVSKLSKVLVGLSDLCKGCLNYSRSG